MSSSAGDGPSSSACKGKALMDGAAEHEPVPMPMPAEGTPCGICFTDSRRAIRGELDSCAHHFCFVCIMAWARVESRCPFCKARFRTIRRPPVPGRLPSERIVLVAERNQVYHPRGNESSVVGADPNVNSRCSACNCSNDEDLLLLCELCDVASHTYCVGLGTTVPEGDWFCNDCATSKEEHSRCQVDDGGSSDQGELDITIEAPTAEPVTDPSISDNVDDGVSSDQGEIEITTEAPTAESVADPSISDIVDEGYSLSSLRRPNARSSGPIPIPSIYHNVDEDYGTNAQRSGSLPVPSVYDIVDEDYEVNAVCRRNVRSTRPERRANDLPSQSTSSDGSHSHESQERGSGRALLHANARFGIERARTLPNSRNLTNRIMMLRESWPALRAGSVGFATHLRNSSASSSVKEHQQSGTPSSKDTSYVNKAWKMLEIAKSAGGRKKCNKPSSQDCTPRFSMGNRSTSFSPIDTILGQMNQSLPPTVAQRNTVKYDRGAKRDNALPGKDIEGQCNLLGSHHPLVRERIGSFQNRMANQASPNGKVVSSSHLQHVDQRPESSCGTKVASSSHRQHADQTLETARGARVSGKPKTDVLDPSANGLASRRPTVVSPVQFVSRAGSQSGTTINSKEPSAVCVATPNEIGTMEAAVEVRKGSRPDRDGSKRKHRSGTDDEQASKKAKKSAKIAKGEISSLVMRELKLLKIDKTYGSDRFKEVARAATHTVLASYGLEHTASVALALPKPVCKHSSRTEPSKPSAITNTCKECLGDFVKQAISSVLSS